ncbi:polysaccharide deacetylase family protein [Streptomyces pinistramenti]|uniref:polysaccharide deacetylase family protein n=1 Tax=Streptomyces pinistramenti TaxID=2884812 RepID=UPI001D07544F|nr:polysaccharide deacetylase family protein [Streptomyces pinistramenti]MCB5912241.1 polysaccharide deacetylase family protein [Streptomyces pinistramenti]
MFLRGAVVVGVLSASRLLPAPLAHTPQPAMDHKGAAGPEPHPAARAPGTAVPASAPDGYRLRPIAGETALSGPGAAPPRADVTFTLPTHTREIALTFDDGPDPRYTPEVLRVLRRHGAQATFFVVGECATEHPGLLHAIAGEGHVVANHTWTHPQLTKLRPAAVRSELGRTSSVIEETLGVAPALARAPYGDWDAAALGICNGLGMSPVGWSVDSQDWTRPGSRRIASTVMGEMQPGAIVLSHDGGGNRSQTVSALEWYLPRLLDQGYTPVRLRP